MPVYRIILLICFYLSLVRGTSIGLFLPADELLLGDIDYRLTKYLNYILLLGVISYFFIINDYKFLIEKILNPPVFIFFIACLISIVFSVDKVQSIKFVISLAAISLPVILYFYRYGTGALIDEMSRFIIILSIICLLYTILLPQYGIMSGKHAGAWRGVFAHKNASGPFFAISFYFLLYQLQKTENTYFFILTFLSAFICIGFVLLSKSSTAAICFLLVGMLYASMYLIYRFKYAAERLGLLFLTLSALIFVSFFGATHFERLLYDLTGKDATLSGRTEIWKPLLDLSYERPLHGYGIGMPQRPAFMSRVHQYITFDAQSSHNSYLDLILGVGYPGALLFLFMALNIFFSSLLFQTHTALLTQQRSLFMSVFLTMFFISFTSSYVLLGRSAFWIFLLMSILALSRRSQAEQKIEKGYTN